MEPPKPDPEPNVDTKHSFLDPEAPFRVGGLVAAGLISGIITLLWWVILRALHCGIDAGGGPPGPPAPSTFGRFDLLFSVGGVALAVIPLLLLASFTDSGRVSRVAQRTALAVALGIAFIALRHLFVGANYWVETC